MMQEALRVPAPLLWQVFLTHLVCSSTLPLRLSIAAAAQQVLMALKQALAVDLEPRLLELCRRESFAQRMSVKQRPHASSGSAQLPCCRLGGPMLGSSRCLTPLALRPSSVQQRLQLHCHLLQQRPLRLASESLRSSRGCSRLKQIWLLLQRRQVVLAAPALVQK